MRLEVRPTSRFSAEPLGQLLDDALHLFGRKCPHRLGMDVAGPTERQGTGTGCLLIGKLGDAHQVVSTLSPVGRDQTRTALLESGSCLLDPPDPRPDVSCPLVCPPVKA